MQLEVKEKECCTLEAKIADLRKEIDMCNSSNKLADLIGKQRYHKDKIGLGFMEGQCSHSDKSQHVNVTNEKSLKPSIISKMSSNSQSGNLRYIAKS